MANQHPYTQMNSDYFNEDALESFPLDKAMLKACIDRNFDVKAASKTIPMNRVHGQFDAFSYWMAYHFIPGTIQEQFHTFGAQSCYVQLYNDLYDNLSLADQNKWHLNDYYFDESLITPEAKDYLKDHAISDIQKAHRLVDYQKWHGAQLVLDWANDRQLPIDTDRHLISYQFYPLYIAYARELSKNLGTKSSNPKALVKKAATVVKSPRSSVAQPSSTSAQVSSLASVSAKSSLPEAQSVTSSTKPSSTVAKSSVSNSTTVTSSSTAPSLTSAQQKSLDASLRDSIVAQKVAESSAKSKAILGNFLNEIKQDKQVQAHSGVGSANELAQLEQNLGQEGLGDFFNMDDTDVDADDQADGVENPPAPDDNYETTSAVVASDANADLPFAPTPDSNDGAQAVSNQSMKSAISLESSSESSNRDFVADGFANMFATPMDDDDDDLKHADVKDDTGTVMPLQSEDDVLNAANLGKIESAKPSYLSTKNWFVHIPDSLAKTLALDVMPVIKTDYLLQDDNPLKHLYINPNAMVTVREMFANHILHDDNLKALMFAQRTQRKTTNYEVSDNDVQESFDIYVAVSLGLYSQVFWKRYCAAKVIAQLSTKDKKGRVAKIKTIDNLKKFKSIHQVLFNHNKAAKNGPNEVNATIRYYLALGLKEPNLMEKTVNANHVNRQLQRLENSELFLRQLVTLMLQQQFPEENWADIVNSKEYKRLVKKMDVLWPDMVNPLKTIQRTGMNKFRQS